LVVAAVVWGARRGRSPYRKLVQPDYEAVAYGDVKEDVVLPKKQQEVGKPNHIPGMKMGAFLTFWALPSSGLSRA
jgi:hypothetical protein